jgi:hypothetical protein
MLQDFEGVREIKRVAEDSLLAIPGGRVVGVGRKIVAGEMTSDTCIIVFAVAKKAVTVIPSDEAIPTETNVGRPR